ncbi:MAG: hypothetical protein IPK69_08780 [Phycisphaerales bacterium]|nr:MAG: hypothetical protein IPK69_08780 [Phycisphaerales bacterium]
MFPTERYYYYNFPLGPRHVSGNIRFADVENGTISVGYFDSYYPRDIEVAEYKDGDSGIRIKYNSELNSVDVAVDEIQRTFILDQSAFSKPPFQLLDGEEFISGVRDESGYFLYLIFWRPGRAFYYVLNTRESVPETWSRGDGAKIETWWGSRSRFCFLHNLQLDRYILVGVHEREVRENTWYDGPFDQVPPNLMIQHTLEVAYPYVIDAGGIDDHGNFLEMEGQRVAISPYQEYSSGPSLEAYLESVVEDRDTPDAWTKATYESKRDWRASRNALGVSAHASELSASWPANHWGISSTRWGAQHDAAVSVSWPPNHSVDTSKDSK